VTVNCLSCGHHAAAPDEIMAENRLPMAVFSACSDEWRVGFGGAYAIDGNVVWRVIDEHRPGNKLDVFLRVKVLASHFLKFSHTKR